MSYSNINRVVLVGRLTADPELRALPTGTTVCNLRLACNGVRKNSDSEYVEKPNFFNVSVYGAQGESVQRYMARGGRLAIDGRLEWREWETAEGLKRQAVEVVAESVEFLDSARPNGSHDGVAPDDSPAEEFGLDSHGDGQERELVGVGSGIEDDVTF
jgi:single-strand DNA-binding protein